MLHRPKAKLAICYFILLYFGLVWGILDINLLGHCSSVESASKCGTYCVCVWQMKFMPSMEIVKVAAKASQRSKCHAKVATTDVRHTKKRRKKLENQNSCFRNWSSHTNIQHCGLPGYLACRKREKTSRQRAQETENTGLCGEAC